MAKLLNGYFRGWLKVIRLRNNESDQCESAILGNLDALYRFAVSLSRNPADAEDLVQETCLRAIRGIAQNGIKSDPKVWLFTILRNVWINEWRRRTNGPEFVLLEKTRAESGLLQDWLSDERQRPEERFDRNVASGKIQLAISSLPEVFREVVVLRYFDGFSYRQIASILGCPTGTVMSRLSRARAELRTALDEKSKSLIVLPRKRSSG
ncbi:MAG TPA: RNA polymerase sigma factor [Candidatus Binatia bacterium]|nr:RNA polymerase sigma factor [Candidatus Binatia bacterium]